jgi:glycylpeptide N-tetradecanoyltransferase
VGVRTTNKARRLVASITGVPAHMSVHGRQMRMCEINFLCVHKRLRSKRLAPVLIKEVTRRVNLRGIFQVRRWRGGPY